MHVLILQHHRRADHCPGYDPIRGGRGGHRPPRLAALAGAAGLIGARLWFVTRSAFYIRAAS